MPGPRLSLVVPAVIVITGLSYIIFHPFAQGSGFGMMHSGMMGMSSRSGETSPVPVDPARANALLGYIHAQNLQCLQCHKISNAGIGPSYGSVAVRYAHQEDATQILSNHIAHGFGRMPQGMASDIQAAELAKLILKLEDTEIPKSSSQGETK